jgi:hypothetical protein
VKEVKSSKLKVEDGKRKRRRRITQRPQRDREELTEIRREKGK